MSLVENIVNNIMSKYGIERQDIDKVKKIIDKIKFTKRDGDNYMIIDIGDGIELSIRQDKV